MRSVPRAAVSLVSPVATYIEVFQRRTGKWASV
jgi:hypothetical protein